MPIEKVCIVCGKKFLVPPARKDTAKACSNACAISVRAKSRERKVKNVCGHCGNVFTVPRSHKDRYNYCSYKCRYLSEKYRSECRERVSGSNNPCWKGGEANHSDGYTYQCAKDHPFASNGYVFKHRLNMERWLKEENPNSNFLVCFGNNLYLSQDAVVHHIDSDRKNNRRRNLLVCTRSAHSKIHNGVMPEPGTYWPHDAKIKLGAPHGACEGRKNKPLPAKGEKAT